MYLIQMLILTTQMIIGGIYKTKTDAYLIDVSDLYTGSQTVSSSSFNK